MTNAARVCYAAGGAEITVASDGTSKMRGIAIDIHRIYVNLLHVPNVTHVYSSDSVARCFERMSDNETDFIFARRPLPINESTFYHIPVPTQDYINQIITGFNYSRYTKSIENEADSNTRLLQNFGIYDRTTICLLVIYFALLFSIFRLTSRLGLDRSRHPRRVSWRRLEGRIKNRKSETRRVLEFIFNVCFFFLAAPFLAQFSTNQVVTSPPGLITTYAEILEKQVKIVLSNDLLDDFLLRPSAESFRKNDIQAQIYEYRKENSMEFGIPKSFSTLTSLQDVSALIDDGKAVMLAPNRVSEGFKDAFCSWTEVGSLTQVLIVSDPSSVEIITGMPFRKGFVNIPLQRKLRRIFESRLLYAILYTNHQYAGFQYKRDVTTPEHRYKQLCLCSSEHLVREQKETRPPGLRSFSLFLTIFFTFLAFISIYHSINLVLSRGPLNHSSQRSRVTARSWPRIKSV